MRLTHLSFVAFAAVALEACADKPGPTDPFRTLAYGARPHSQLGDGGFADGFEAATFDAFWQVTQNFGTVSPTSLVAKTGSQSAALASVSGGQRGLEMIHQFQGPVTGRFSIYFYDTAPGQETLYEGLILRNSTAPEMTASVGTRDFDAYCYAVVLTDVDGALQGPNKNCGIFPQTTTTDVARSAGWHLLEIETAPGSVSFFIDAAKVFSGSGDFSFDRVTVTVTGPFWRPNTTAYFDDFSFVPLGPVNRSPLASPGGNTTPGVYSALEGTPVTFDGSGSADPDGDALSFSWDFGDDVTGVGPNASHTYADNGSYTASLTVSDGRGASDTKSATVSVANVPPTVTGFSSPSQTQLNNGSATVQIANVTFTDPAGAVDAPFTTTIACGNQANATAQGACVYSAPGTYTLAVRVTDKDGGVSAPRTANVAVTFPFAGFLEPVDNLPTINNARAGSAIPVKFSLGGDYGLAILTTGYPASGPTVCDPNAPSEDVESTTTAGSSSLSYDPTTQTYVYVWKTEKAWAGSCRQLVVKLIDGTEHRAIFRLR